MGWVLIPRRPEHGFPQWFRCADAALEALERVHSGTWYLCRVQASIEPKTRGRHPRAKGLK